VSAADPGTGSRRIDHPDVLEAAREHGIELQVPRIDGPPVSSAQAAETLGCKVEQIVKSILRKFIDESRFAHDRVFFAPA
jgi:hypothetical protein